MGKILTITCSGLVLLMAINTSANDYFISPEGNDSNPGTIEKPLRSLKRIIRKLKPGDTCYFRKGHYLINERVKNLKGAPGKPITFTSYNDEKAVIDGTVPIEGSWEKVKGNIYKIKLKRDIWQVFINGKGAMLARWPNAKVEDKTAFKSENYGYADRKKSTNEIVYDEKLVDAGIDFTGATVIAIGNNNVHKVAKHQKGAKTFTLDPFVKRWRIGAYSLEGKMCLDMPGEWWYDKDSKELFLVVPEGRKPENLNIRGKIQDFAFTGDHASYITFKDLTFLGTTLNLSKCDHIVVEDCLFTYPNHNKRVLGNNTFANTTLHAFDNTLKGNGFEKKTENILRNNVFEYVDGSALVSNGWGDLIENNYFHHVGFNGLERYAVNMKRSLDSIFRRNTIHTIAGYAAVLPGQGHVVELNDANDAYEGSDLTHESTLIHVFMGNQKDIFISRNWIHDSGTGIRFDTPNNGTKGYDGEVANNVMWNATRIIIKGDKHSIHHNTCFDCDEQANDIVIHKTKWGDNKNSEIYSNASDTISGHRNKKRKPKEPFPGKQYNNFIGVMFDPVREVRNELRDPDNRDFRPKADSEMAKKDIGAYKANCKDYWIPGRKITKASMPIPADGAKFAKTDSDLIWLGAYKATDDELYFGTEKNAVAKASASSPEYKGKQKHNIFKPGKLQPGKTYYWRVDAIKKGKTIKGNVWSFTVK